MVEMDQMDVMELYLRKGMMHDGRAYTLLVMGTNGRLSSTITPWWEKIVWRLVRRVALKQLKGLDRLVGNVELGEGYERFWIQEMMVKAEIKAALDGHILGPWKKLDEKGLKWVVQCVHCDMGVGVNSESMIEWDEKICPGPAQEGGEEEA